MATIPATHIDLLETNPNAVLTTNGADGYPQVTAVGFLVEDGTIKMSLNTKRQKTINLTRDPKVTMFFVDPQNEHRTLEIRANAVVEPDPDFVFAAKVSAKYGGFDIRSMDGPGDRRVVVSLEPVKVNILG